MLPILAALTACLPGEDAGEDTGAAVLPDCTGPGWLSDAPFEPVADLHALDASWPTFGNGFALSPEGEPVVLVNSIEPASYGSRYLSIRWREPGDLDGVIPHGADWGGTFDRGTGEGRTPRGSALEAASDGSIWFAGQLSDGERTVPFGARLSPGSGDIEHWVLDEGVDHGIVVAIAFTPEGNWFLGNIVDPAVGGSELVLWRIDIDGTVHEELRTSELADGDASGAMLPGALTATRDGRLLVGGGTYSASHPGERAFLYLGDSSGFEEVASIGPEQTGGFAGLVEATALREDGTLVLAWNSTHDLTDDFPSRMVFEGLLSDPASLAAIDVDGEQESAYAEDLALHPSGAVLVAGGRFAGSESGTPALRLGDSGVWSTPIDGTEAGRVVGVEVDASGRAWALVDTWDPGAFESTRLEVVRASCE